LELCPDHSDSYESKGAEKMEEEEEEEEEEIFTSVATAFSFGACQFDELKDGKGVKVGREKEKRDSEQSNETLKSEGTPLLPYLATTTPYPSCTDFEGNTSGVSMRAEMGSPPPPCSPYRGPSAQTMVAF
jgi:hypothetical protein